MLHILFYNIQETYLNRVNLQNFINLFLENMSCLICIQKKIAQNYRQKLGSLARHPLFIITQELLEAEQEFIREG